MTSKDFDYRIRLVAEISNADDQDGIPFRTAILSDSIYLASIGEVHHETDTDRGVLHESSFEISDVRQGPSAIQPNSMNDEQRERHLNAIEAGYLRRLMNDMVYECLNDAIDRSEACEIEDIDMENVG